MSTEHVLPLGTRFVSSFYVLILLITVLNASMLIHYSLKLLHISLNIQKRYYQTRRRGAT